MVEQYDSTLPSQSQPQSQAQSQSACRSKGRICAFANLYDAFINRQLGGIELEVFLALVEIGCALQLLGSSFSILHSISLAPYYGKISHVIIAIPWMLSGTSTLVGVVLFFRGNRWCAPLRWGGSMSSAVIWTWVLVESCMVTQGLYPVLGLPFYVLSILASLRIMVGAYRRYRKNSKTG